MDTHKPTEQEKRANCDACTLADKMRDCPACKFFTEYTRAKLSDTVLLGGLFHTFGEDGVMSFNARANNFFKLSNDELSREAAKHRAAEIAKWDAVYGRGKS